MPPYTRAAFSKIMKHVKELNTHNILRNESLLHLPLAYVITAPKIQQIEPKMTKKSYPNKSYTIRPCLEYSKPGIFEVATFCALRGSIQTLSNEVKKPALLSPQLTIGFRHFSQGRIVLKASDPLKPTSKLGETVDALKEKAKEQLIESPSTDKKVDKKKEKKPLMQRIKAELLHYYHGFRLLFVNTKICAKFCVKILRGEKLTRRENKLMTRTMGDLFRLVPFSVFIIVPFLELTLPLFLKFFPGMLPSTFETKSQKESKMKKKFQIQLQMTSFLQQTLQNMAVGGKGHESEESAKFVQFFEKVRTSGGVVTSDEVMKFSKMFRDEVTLDNLSHAQLKALCRVLGIKIIGTPNFLRFQLGLRLRSLQADDKMIHKEGVNSLTTEELQMACQARGMPAWGVSEERLKQQLTQWLHLSVEKKVSPSLLLLSQAFMFPSNTPTEEKLAATIQSLPEGVVKATKAEIQVREGKIDYKTKLDLLREEMEQIAKERKEMCEEEKTKKVVEKTSKHIFGEGHAPDPAKTPITPVPSRLQPDEEVVKSDEIAALKWVLSRKLRLEKEKLAAIVNEMNEYEQGSKELTELLSTIRDADVRESKAAKRLKKKLKKLITKLSASLSDLEAGEKILHDIQEKRDISKTPRSELIKIDEFVEALNALPGKASIDHDRLIELVHRLDKNKDGYVTADVVLKIIEILGDEEISLTKKQFNEIIDLLEKEEILETDLQIFRALSKGDAVSELKKELEKRRAEIVDELKKEKKELSLKKREEEITKLSLEDKTKGKKT